MTQTNEELTVPEPHGTSPTSFHAIGSLEGWHVTPSPNLTDDRLPGQEFLVAYGQVDGEVIDADSDSERQSK